MPEQCIGFLRQWLNEDRITDPKKMVTNEQLERWLEPILEENNTLLRVPEGHIGVAFRIGEKTHGCTFYLDDPELREKLNAITDDYLKAYEEIMSRDI